MINKRFFRTALMLALAAAIVLSVTGGTIAWFTDTVESSGNVIQAGNLDMEVYAVDGKAYQGAATAWGDALTNDSKALFDYDRWEPGFTQVKYIKVRNAGNLAFKFQAAINSAPAPADGKADLAKVIDVYMAPAQDAAFADFAAIKAAAQQPASIRALADAANGAANGILLPEAGKGAANVVDPVPAEAKTGEVIYCVALHMREEAGNEYQNRSVGNGFGIRIEALQYSYEKDSFDHTYDADTKFPENGPVVFNGVAYQTLQELFEKPDILSQGGTIVLNKNQVVSNTLNVPGNITIHGNGCTISREDGFTGTLFTVEAGNTLTLEKVTVDGGAKWTGAVDATLQRGTQNTGVTATGNLIATGNNAKIVLNQGAVLQNNAGAYAVNLGTRIGATLTLNGGQIINNQSDSGAIWGGGHITMNDGKINGNASTGIAGAIRMVSSCNLTMTGGEISHNKANGDGGAIWGYGSSTYNFTGGKIANNEAVGTGGFMYTGTNSVINISGDAALVNNKAANSGAIRLTDHTSLTMTGGTISGNTQNGESNAFNTWNNTIALTGGKIEDNFSYVGGLGLTMGAVDMDGVVSYALATNHNTAYLAENFNGFSFKVNESNDNSSNFNFKPADGYTYTQGDEAKLVCMNEGYETYWDANTNLFKLRAK